MHKLLQFRGARALQEFRLAKLLPQLQSAQPGIRGLSAEFRHFVECEEALGAEEQTLLLRLLEYGAPPQAAEPGCTLYLVVPRVGTISPWS